MSNVTADADEPRNSFENDISETSSSPPNPPIQSPPPLKRSASIVFYNLDVKAELEDHFVIAALRDEKKTGELRDLLSHGKATLFLPVSASLVHVAEKISPAFFEHHVFIPNPENMRQVMSLGGIRALVKGSRLIVIGPRPTEQELLSIYSRDTGTDDKTLSIWDTIDAEATTIDQYPSIELLSDTPVDFRLSDNSTIKVALMSRAIMQEDLTRNFAPKLPPRKPPAYNTSLITLPAINFDIRSIPSNVFTQIGALPYLFSKLDVQAVLEDAPCLQNEPSYQVFMEQMKDPRCGPFAAEVQRYLVSIIASRQPVSSETLSTYHHRFIDSMQKTFTSTVFLRQQGPGHIESLTEGLDNYVLAQAYATYFISVLSEEQTTDLLLHRKISLMSVAGFNLDQLGIHIELDSDALKETVKLAGVELLIADRTTTPHQKLSAIVASHQRVAERVPLCFPSDDESSSADMLLPLLIYVVVKTNPPRLASCLKYINRFRAHNKIEGYSSYCLTNLAAVQSFVETSDVQALGLSPYVEASFRPKPANSNSEKIIVLPGDMISAPDPPSKPVMDTIGTLANIVGQRISGLWPFRRGATQEAVGHVDASAHNDSERLWSRLKHDGKRSSR
ncbi:hypothetical protein SpCBS45565_g01474 [Spizellomyces sp. 'palustris']|nr:hypothetical protein SpCBS45565_g01474 [Spizellomyces sp. 'palustris']